MRGHLETLTIPTIFLTAFNPDRGGMERDKRNRGRERERERESPQIKQGEGEGGEHNVGGE